MFQVIRLLGNKIQKQVTIGNNTKIDALSKPNQLKL